jgi:aldose 1-epimerase
MKSRLASLVVFLAVIGLAPAASAQRYTAVRDGDAIRLTDRTTETVVAIRPSNGNLGYEMTVKGHSILSREGIPFMGPWANRLDEQAFYANGTRHAFDMTLGNIRGRIPIHGFLTTTDQWQVTTVRATGGGAEATSRLDFAAQPLWMRQWPFAHTIDITYRLSDGALEVAIAIANTGTEPMPIAIGFHPYFQLTDSPRDEWRISLGAGIRWLLSPEKLPTGETEPIARLFPSMPARLADYNLDDVFGDLVRNRNGLARMTVHGKQQRIDVDFGPRYRAAVVYAPTGRGFICFEPMAGITNAVNMAHKGTYKELQSVAPGGTWRESFWIRPSGF